MNNSYYMNKDTGEITDSRKQVDLWLQEGIEVLVHIEYTLTPPLRD